MSELNSLPALSEPRIQNLGSNNESTGNSNQQSNLNTQTTINKHSTKFYNMMDSNIQNNSISPELEAITLSQAETDVATDSKIEGKYTCAVCDSTFSRKQNLKAHLVTHTEKKPYLCNHCGFSFRRPYDLRRHERIHTDEKPFTCMVCSKTFPRKDALNRHTKSCKGCYIKDRSFTEDQKVEKKRRRKDREINAEFDNRDVIDANNENNFFLQEALQETRKNTDNESKLRNPNVLDITESASAGNSPNLDLTKLNPIPLKEIFSNILTEAMSAKSQFDPISSSDGMENETLVQLSESQMQLLKMIFEKINDLDTRVSIIEQMLHKKSNNI